MTIGTREDETCNRDGCGGKMAFGYPSDSCCSCHNNPPCGYCMDSLIMCSECLEGEEDTSGHEIKDMGW